MQQIYYIIILVRYIQFQHKLKFGNKPLVIVLTKSDMLADQEGHQHIYR